jgi:DNA topoisomerase I
MWYPIERRREERISGRSLLLVFRYTETIVLVQLIHNGIVIPEPPEPTGLRITVRGREVALTPEQEEMALAWARKKDTDYVRDPVFAANFMRDFSAALGIDPPLTINEVDFSRYEAYVDEERAAKEDLSPEQRKEQAAQRKAEREALKAKYGYAIVNGQRVELGTYLTEPSGIFMGRGQHPLRGRWKEGARASDVTLNLSPDAPSLDNPDFQVVWQPDSLWVARWKDKLSDKMKYIWLGDTAPLRQEREADKFDKAIRLESHVDAVRGCIQRDLRSDEARVRMIATACYLIDQLCLRVGDEKDADEADTVGATTLRAEHIIIHSDTEVEIRFLGKDSVEWHKRIELPELVVASLRELADTARSSGDGGAETRNGRNLQLFPNVTSRDVNVYLSEIMPGLTAKVFRTYHATRAVSDSLEGSGVEADDPEYLKWEAANLANLEAAMLCNHTKQYKGDWARTKGRYQERQEKAKERIERYRLQIAEALEKRKALEEEAKTKAEEAATPELRRQVRARYRQRIASAQERLQSARERRKRAENALGKVKAQLAIASEKRQWNLGTSLKSYIDPRIYYRWGRQVDYDVLEYYYPATLRRKFAWVRAVEDQQMQDELPDDLEITVRACMTADLKAVVCFFQKVLERYPHADLPLDMERIEKRYLPSLEEDWQEAFIAIKDDEVVGFAAVGPVWMLDEETLLDAFGVLPPAPHSEAVAALLARATTHRLRAYRLQHPKEDFVLCPQDDAWFELAPDLADAFDVDQEEGVDAGEEEVEAAQS